MRYKDSTIASVARVLDWNVQSVHNARQKHYSFWLLTEVLRYTEDKSSILELLFIYKECGAKYWDVLTTLLLNDYIHCPAITMAKPFITIPVRFKCLL